MVVSFNSIPAAARTPFVFVELDSTRAQQFAGARKYAALIIGQRTTGVGTVAELIPTKFTREEQVATAFGPGSMIHEMARAYFAQSPGADTTFIAIDDPSGGTAATGSIAFAASSPQAGTVAVYVGGRRYTVPCSTASTANSLAAALAAAITADPWKPVTASASTNTVTLTARHAGVAAGAIDIRHSHAADEALPLGVTLTITAMSGGAGAIDLAEVVAVMPADTQFHAIANPYTDSSNLGVIETELTSRWGPERQIGAIALQATSANLATAQALGNGRNSAFSCIAASYGSPSPTWMVAAAIAAVVVREAPTDPARPYQTLELAGIVAPKLSTRLSRAERDLLLFDGVATLVVNAAGNVTIERLVTTYQVSPAGQADIAYLDVTTPLTLDRLRYDVRTLFGTRYARHKIANDGTRFAQGQAIVTPKVARAELLALARQWESEGLVEDVEGFKNDLIVERNATDPSRLDMYIPPNLVNGLVVIAAQLGFRV